MTLLEIVTRFCELHSLPTPTLVVGGTDAKIAQIRAILEKGGMALASRGAWEMLTYEALWTTTATEDQGALTTLAPNNYNFMLPDTLWDRTEMLPLLGPTSSRAWQYLKAIVITGPRYSFRIKNGHFYTTPAPAEGHTWVFEYVSKNWIATAADPDVTTDLFESDDDEILLPWEIVLADLEWRWKAEKGLAYAEDFNHAERLINDAIGRDAGKRILAMDNREPVARPNIFVPPGNWPL